MDVFDKFFKKYSYKFNKGYPDMNNDQDVLLLESILDKLNLEVELQEGTPNQNSKKAIDIILDSEYKSKFKRMATAGRIGNADKVLEDEFVKILTDLFGTEVSVYGPSEGPNPSRQYKQFEFEVPGEGKALIILAGGPKAETSERQEMGFINAINSIEGIKTIIGKNGYKIPNVIEADKYDLPGYRYEPYSDIQLKIQGQKNPYLISAKGSSAPTLAGGGLAGITVLEDEVKEFVKLLYNKAYEFYKNIFDNTPEVDYNTSLYKTKYFRDVSIKIPENIVLEILEGTPSMGGPVDAYYIGPMDVESKTEGSTIRLNGDIIPIEELAKDKTLYAHIKKRAGDYYFTDSTQTVNGITIPRIFTDKPGGSMAKSRFGILDKVRGIDITDK